MNNPLDAIMEWYRTAYDSMRLATRVLTKGTKGVVKREYSFAGQAPVEAVVLLEKSVGELENVVVLALVAVFERTLRQHFVDAVNSAFPPGDAKRDSLRDRLADDVERWELLKLIDASRQFSAADPGAVKNLVKFRNWVAHGHFINQPPTMNAVPKDAYKHLTAFLQQANVI